MPLLENPVFAAELPQEPAQVRALFAVSQLLERNCIRLYARSQTCITAGVHATAETFLQELQEGDCPQVVAVDVLLPETTFQTILQSVQKLPCSLSPKILLLTPFPETAAARGALHRLDRYARLVRPYSMQTLFDTVYALGADERSTHIYHIQRLCGAALQSLKADPALTGTLYLKRILLCALLYEQELPLSRLYQIAGEERGIDEKAVTAALSRLSGVLYRRHTAEYVALCQRCGCTSQTPLSNGRLIRALIEELRTYL